MSTTELPAIRRRGEVVLDNFGRASRRRVADSVYRLVAELKQQDVCRGAAEGLVSMGLARLAGYLGGKELNATVDDAFARFYGRRKAGEGFSHVET